MPVFSQPSGPRVGTGTNPTSVAIDRFNSDAFDDLAVTNAVSNDVTILLGNGTGGFAQAIGSPVTVGFLPISVVVGRFNADALDDLAVANNSSGNVSLLLGDGNGGFVAAPGSPVSVGSLPMALGVGHFNGDGPGRPRRANGLLERPDGLLSSCPLADLGVGIADASDSIVPDSDLTYTVTVQNARPDAVSAVTVTVQSRRIGGSTISTCPRCLKAARLPSSDSEPSFISFRTRTRLPQRELPSPSACRHSHQQ